LDPVGLLPETPYTKEELRFYLHNSRRKCQAAIKALTDEKTHQRCSFLWGEVSYAELLLDIIRHI